MSDDQLSIVDILLGRHQHEPLMKVTNANRVYHNYRAHDPSLKAELDTGGRHRNREEFEAVENPVGETVRRRGY